MQQRFEGPSSSPAGLRNAMQQTPRLRAVIRSGHTRIVIAFSDGRTHFLDHAHCLATDQLIVAAVHWCRRHGADVVEISP